MSNSARDHDLFDIADQSFAPPAEPPQQLRIVPSEEPDRTPDQLYQWIGDLEAEVSTQRDCIVAMGAATARDRAEVQNLKTGLASARSIGAAIGILMATRHLTDKAAFALLAEVSQATNTKLRDLADDVMLTGTLEVAPTRPSKRPGAPSE